MTNGWPASQRKEGRRGKETEIKENLLVRFAVEAKGCATFVSGGSEKNEALKGLNVSVPMGDSEILS
jgi:hypothetical protein